MYEDEITDAINELGEALAEKKRRIDEYDAWVKANPQGHPGGMTSNIGDCIQRVEKAQARINKLNEKTNPH